MPWNDLRLAPLPPVDRRYSPQRTLSALEARAVDDRPPKDMKLSQSAEWAIIFQQHTAR